MKRIFIDCGFHHGEGLKHFIEKLGIDHTWEVHCFEPNPECHLLERLKSFVNVLDDQQIFPHTQAVWIADKKIKFSQEDWAISESGSPCALQLPESWSSLDGWASCITELNKAWPGLATPIEVNAINFSLWLDELAYNSRAVEIYIKMDIEGAEFKVLRKMLKDGTLQFVNKIWVEFHERYIPGENRQTKATLIRELSQCTEVEEWH
jgi:FkbM family methyltransferase